MSIESGHCEDRVSKLEDKVIAGDQVFRDTLETERVRKKMDSMAPR